MKMSKVGNQTNSQDPQAVNSRVFVGNLNTFQCSKTDVERMFQRYGRLAGISMHKGYAFVQFTNPFDARSACLGEDGRTVLSQILDVNMVAEPKPHQTGRKRQNVAKTGNDWDYYYDSYYASTTAFPMAPAPHRLVPPAKRPRLMAAAGSGRNGKSANQTQKSTLTTTTNTSAPSASTHIDQLKIYSNPDILICGNCREMYTDLQDLLDHKKTYCKLRFTCKCHTVNGFNGSLKSVGDENNDRPHQQQPESYATLLCVQCKDSFENAWDLMVHAQAAHMLNIYELGVPHCNQPTPDNALLKESEKNGILAENESDRIENGRNGLSDAEADPEEKDLDEMMLLDEADEEATAQATGVAVAARQNGTVSASVSVSSTASSPSPPPLAATAPPILTATAVTDWKQLSPKLRH